jgi:hypothetical protein
MREYRIFLNFFISKLYKCSDSNEKLGNLKERVRYMILQLLAEAGSVQDVFPEVPGALEVQPTDVVVGVLGPQYRAVFTMAERQRLVMSAKNDQLSKLVEQVTGLNYEEIPADTNKKGISLVKERREARERYGILTALLRQDLNEEFSFPEGCATLEIRKGWQVVGVKRSQSLLNSLDEGLKNLNCGFHGTAAKEAAKAEAAGMSPV